MDLESNAFLIKVGELQAIEILKHPSCISKGNSYKKGRGLRLCRCDSQMQHSEEQLEYY